MTAYRNEDERRYAAYSARDYFKTRGVDASRWPIAKVLREYEATRALDARVEKSRAEAELAWAKVAELTRKAGEAAARYDLAAAEAERVAALAKVARVSAPRTRSTMPPLERRRDLPLGRTLDIKKVLPGSR